MVNMVYNLNKLQSLQIELEYNKKESRFNGKTYLAYSAGKGFYAERLNWIQVILRRFCCFYKSNTHLSYVSFKLKKIEPNDFQNENKIKTLVAYIMNKHDQINWSLNSQEVSFIVKLESMLQQGRAISSCVQDFNRLGYKYSPGVSSKAFSESIDDKLDNLTNENNKCIDEISSLKSKIENAKESLKSTENLNGLYEKRKENEHLYKSYDDTKKCICQVRAELEKLILEIKIKISQTLEEKRRAFHPSICSMTFFEYVIRPSFWEKLSCCFYYFDEIGSIEHNISSYEQDLNLSIASYRNTLNAQLKQMYEKEASLRKERKKKYEEEETEAKQLIEDEHKQKLENIHTKKEQLNEQIIQGRNERCLQRQLQEIDLETERQRKLQEIDHEIEQQKCAQELIYETQLEKLDRESELKNRQLQQHFNREKIDIYNNFKQASQEMASDWEALRQDISEYLCTFQNTNRINFYTLVIRKINESNIDAAKMEEHLYVLTEILQKEKIKFFSISYNEIIPILESLDFNNVSESLTTLKAIREKISNL